MIQYSKLKVEYGDFQTPLELAEKICHKLLELGVNPDLIIEPTCGVGNFILASARLFPSARKIIGVEINPNYLREVRHNRQFLTDDRIQVQQGDFFEVDWVSLIKEDKKILLLGNFPWVTNSQQGAINGKNLPEKINFQSYKGIEAITGKSNFDISEWMLIQSVRLLQDRDTSLAMLCKTSVARKLLNYLHSNNLKIAYYATYGIDAKKYFDVNVDACLLFCKFDSNSRNYFCDIFDSLDVAIYNRTGYHQDIMVKNIKSFDKLKELYDHKHKQNWRSGVKHDCAKIMELRKIDDKLLNGLNEIVDIEDTFIFPLYKGSDVAQNRITKTDKYILITQKYINEPTEFIESVAPKTWIYLKKHSKYFEARKSKIYKKAYPFSIFGVGSYTFAPWKIAICGLYKNLNFRLIGENNNKPTIFDDTVYFLSFENAQIAQKTFNLLTSPTAIDFYSSLIFWDEKRPIKSSILNSLDLTALAQKLGAEL